ncbi:MAG: hypothetical protein M3P18_09095 [Actinomycetota bacterium]|nr:hypothetical protein [Actinomycetota bacterium]
MNGHAIAGLVALNLFLLIVGVSILYALRGWASWGELLRLAGVAYMLGVAATSVVWTFELVLGISFGLTTIIGTGAALALVASLAGYRAGHRLPRLRMMRHLPGLSLVTAVFVAVTVVYLEAAFRAARLAGLYEFDAWAFWVPKAKAIYYFGGFDEQFFRELINQAYPPLVPVLEAAAFNFMGSPDVVTVHLQFWFLLVGFTAAVVGLLSGRVSPMFIWPPLLLMLVAPHVGGHFYHPTADFLLDELFAIAALLIALWLSDRKDWQLVAAGLLLAAVMLTKREGYAFAASAIVAALVVTARERRIAWPKLIVVGIVAAATTVPWRVLLAVRDIGGGGPEAGGTGLFSNLDRAWPSLRLSLSTLFDYHLWIVVTPLAIVAIVAAFAAGARALPLYTTLVYLFAVVAFTYSTWAFPSLGISKAPALNPIVRLTGEVVLLTPALVPLLLARAWRRAPQ